MLWKTRKDGEIATDQRRLEGMTIKCNMPRLDPTTGRTSVKKLVQSE
jgi:hypothetical protein